MPGFNIGGGDGPPNAPDQDIHRVHRWQIENLGGYITHRHLIYAKSLQLPNFTAEEEVVMGAAIKYKFAKAINWEDVQVSFYDTNGLYSSILEWQDAVYTVAGGIKPAASYKEDSSFYLTDGEGQPSGPHIQLKNSWPKSVTHTALTYDSSDLKLVEVTLSYDWAEFSTAS